MAPDTSPARDAGVPRVFLVCAGLDHAWRGFETFARECFDALRGRPDLDMTLVKGTGTRGASELTAPILRRDGGVARLLGRATRLDAIVIEHLAFAVGLMPLLAMRSPDVVYFSEWHVGRALSVWRRITRQRFTLVLCNGALAGSGYGHLDHVQQIAPGAIEHAVGEGQPAERQSLLPLGVRIDPEPPAVTDRKRAALRLRLGLPRERTIVLSAGAIVRQKRIDYLVDEVAAMPPPRPFLLLLGQEQEESAAIKWYARERLGHDGHDVRTVPPDAMPDYYRASDAFVLASLWESFGRVLVEAQAHGLPCLAHAYPVMEWVLGAEGETRDLERPGAVQTWLAGLPPNALSIDAKRRRHREAYARFSWETLADRYAELLCAAAPRNRSTAAVRSMSA